MRARLPALMLREGLPYDDRTMTYNSRLAQELATWAVTQPNGDRIHDALFRAYFAEGRNLADVDVLAGVAVQVGLPEADAREVLAVRACREAVDRDWERSGRLGLAGVPAFIAGSKGLLGAQPYEALERLVVEAGATRY